MSARRAGLQHVLGKCRSVILWHHATDIQDETRTALTPAAAAVGTDTFHQSAMDETRAALAPATDGERLRTDARVGRVAL